MNEVRYAKLCDRPDVLPVGRPRGAKALGTRYERAVALAIPNAFHGPWFQYWGDGGLRYCQPDFLFESEYDPGPIVCLEVKHTWLPYAHVQLEGLYGPVVRCATEREVVGVVVANWLTDGMGGLAVVNCMTEALWAARRGYRVVLHWLGVSAAPLQVPGLVSPQF